MTRNYFLSIILLSASESSTFQQVRERRSRGVEYSFFSSSSSFLSLCVWIYGLTSCCLFGLVVPVSCTKRFEEGRTTTHTTTYIIYSRFTIFDDRCCIFTSPLFSPLIPSFPLSLGFFFSVGPGVCRSSRWEEQEKEAPFLYILKRNHIEPPTHLNIFKSMKISMSTTECEQFSKN